MENLEEKKWFVYMTDHHVGPLSLSEIDSQINQGVVKDDQYVWCEGMDDWQQMTEVGAFQSLLSRLDAESEVSIQTQSSTNGHAIQEDEISLALDTEANEVVAQPTETTQSEDVEGISLEAVSLEDPAEEMPAPVLEEAEPEPGSSEPSGVEAVDLPVVAVENTENALPLEAVPTEAVGPDSLEAVEVAAEAESPQYAVASDGNLELQTGGGTASLSLESPQHHEIHGMQGIHGETPVSSPAALNAGPAVAGAGLGQAASMPGAVTTSPTPAKKKKSGFILLLIVIVGLGFAHYRGYLDPVLQSGAFRAAKTTISDFVHPHLIQLSEKVPFFAKWFSPIPSLEDVAHQDYQALKKAATTVPQDGGSIQMAVSQKDPKSPFFYVSSNLPNFTRFDLFIFGVPETLLNSYRFETRSTVIINNHLGKTKPISQTESLPLPQGEYTIYAMESAQQEPDVQRRLNSLPPASVEVPDFLPSGRKVILKKRFFLGGVSDATYKKRLKAYHQKLGEKASQEIAELKQFESLLANQLKSTQSQFLRLKDGAKTRPKIRAWNQFSENWIKLQGTMGESFSKWTPEMIKTVFFYGKLYALTKETGAALGRIHGLHHSYFNSAGNDPKAFQSELDDATDKVALALKTIKDVIVKLETKKSSSTGMPPRLK